MYLSELLSEPGLRQKVAFNHFISANLTNSATYNDWDNLSQSKLAIYRVERGGNQGSFLATLAKSIGFKLARESSARDAQEFCGTLLMTFGLVQRLHDERALHFIQWG